MKATLNRLTMLMHDVERNQAELEAKERFLSETNQLPSEVNKTLLEFACKTAEPLELRSKLPTYLVWDKAVEAADKALYRAKRQRRSRATSNCWPAKACDTP